MRIITAVTLCLFFLFAGVAHAEMKVAVFSLQEVASKSDAFQEARKKMAETYDSKKKEVEAKRDALEKLGKSMTASATKEQQDKFRKLQKEYTDLANLYVSNLQQAEMHSRQVMDNLISAAAKQLAAEKGYTIVLDAAAALYFDPAMDVTNDMLTMANKIWKEDQKK